MTESRNANYIRKCFQEIHTDMFRSTGAWSINYSPVVRKGVYMCVYIYKYIYVCVCIYRERERESVQNWWTLSDILVKQHSSVIL